MSDEKEMRTVNKGGRKLLVVGLLAGLVAGGGGAAGYFLFAEDQAAEPAPVAPPVASKTSFIKIERISAPLVRDDTVVGYMLLDLSLELGKAEDELLIARRLPALRAAFLQEVTREPIGKPGQPLIIDYERLPERLRDAANRELTTPAVMRVLITQSVRI